MDALPLKPIGIIRTGHSQSAGTPLQPVYAGEARGTAVLEPEYAVGLRDLVGFSRVWLLFWLKLPPFFGQWLSKEMAA